MARGKIMDLLTGTYILVSLLLASAVEAVPVHTYQAGEQTYVSRAVDGCPVVNMTAEEHPVFYEFCYNVDRNETRHTAYLPAGYDTAAVAFEGFVNPLRNEERVPMSNHCLAYLRPFVCFSFFPFPYPFVTRENCSFERVTYVKPCRDFCEKTFEACAIELEEMIAGQDTSVNELRHLECDKIDEHRTPCVSPDDLETTGVNNTDSEGEEALQSSSAPPACKCANVRDSVTQRTFTAYEYSLAAHISVISFEEQEDHVVYTVEVVKQYQISCQPLLEGNVTQVHTQQPLACRGESAADSDCVHMEVEHEYMIVGHYGLKGEWLLKDLKGTGGTVVSPWITKYENNMDGWVEKVRPHAEKC